MQLEPRLRKLEQVAMREDERPSFYKIVGHYASAREVDMESIYAEAVAAGFEREDVFVALKPIVESMGVDWNGQYQRVKRDPVLSEGMCVMHIPFARLIEQQEAGNA